MIKQLTIKPQLVTVAAATKNLLAEDSKVVFDLTKETDTTTPTENDSSDSDAEIESTDSSIESSSDLSEEVSATTQSSTAITEDSQTKDKVVAQAQADVMGSAGAYDLLIGENSFSRNMKVVTNNPNMRVQYLPNGTNRTALGNIAEYPSNIRNMFVANSAANSVLISNPADGMEIKAFYDNVGYYNAGSVEKPDLKEVAAYLKVSNIQFKNYNGSGKPAKAAIQFSDNMYSGVSYMNIESFNLTIRFYDSSSPDREISDQFNGFENSIDLPMVNFVESGKSYLTFASLNPSTKNGNKDFDKYEFAGARTADGGVRTAAVNDEGELKGDLVALNGGGIGNNKFLASASKNTYFGDLVKHGSELNGWNGSNAANGNGDKLGLPNFWRTAVSFSLIGTENYFVLGSTNAEAWNTLSSNAVLAVKQTPPIKTVQPLKALTDTGWDAESDFAHRFDNDLDRKWELGSVYRVPGHDPADPANFLSQYLAEPGDRYLEKGDEFYYFINQQMINLYSQSMVLPTQIRITDTIPTGIAYTADDIVVYDLHGNIFNNKYYEIKNDGNFSLTFTKEGTKELNKQSGAIYTDGRDDHPVYGGTVSIRIKSKVTNQAPVGEDIPNQAQSFFIYGKDNEKKQDSNEVDIQIKDKLTVLAEKVWQDNGNANNLRPSEITLQLQRKLKTEAETAYQDVAGKSYTIKKDDKDDQLKHTFTELAAGNAQGIPYDYRVVERSDDSLFGLYKKESAVAGNKTVFTNTLLQLPLNLEKITNSTAGNRLAGAEFTLTRFSDKYLTEDRSQKITTTGQGNSTFEQDLIIGSYSLKETKTPVGYAALEGEIAFDVVEKDGQLVLENLVGPEGVVNSLGVDEENNGPIIQVKNTLKPFGLTVAKVDEEEKALAGAEFTLTGPNAYKKVISEGTTFSFTNLKPGTYTLEETKTPAGYRTIKSITMIIDKLGKVTIDGDEQKDVLVTGAENNQIKLQVKNIPKSPLPATGGSGIWPILASGLLALTVVGTYFWCRKEQEVA